MKAMPMSHLQQHEIASTIFFKKRGMGILALRLLKTLASSTLHYAWFSHCHFMFNLLIKDLIINAFLEVISAKPHHKTSSIHSPHNKTYYISDTNLINSKKKYLKKRKLKFVIPQHWLVIYNKFYITTDLQNEHVQFDYQICNVPKRSPSQSNWLCNAKQFC